MRLDELTHLADGYRFQHPMVAELAWIIASTPTMSDHQPGAIWKTLDDNWFREQFEYHLPWLLKLDSDPEELIQFMGDGQMLLGKRFEKLIAFWLKASDRFDLIFHSLQIAGKRNTLGEVDFLLRDLHSSQLFHMEVACKFYLGYRNSPAWDHWIGPNAKDSLQLKMDKLKLQLSIFESTEGKAILQELRLSKPEPLLMMKGFFFHHFRVLQTHKNPKHSNRSYPAGWYAHQSEIGIFPGDSGDWILLQKNSWLSPFHRLEDYRIFSGKALLEELRDHFRKSKRSILVARVYNDGVKLVEIDRGFIVSDKWPR